jgi:iron complex outermembrane receptor protein
VVHGTASAQTDDLPLDALLSAKISTAAKYDQQMSEVAASVTVIGSEEIQRYGWTTIDELLGAIRGLYVTNDRNFSSLGVRGISRPTDHNSRLLVLIDGNPITGTLYGETWTGNSLAIALSSIDRVEFVRGPGSALYGTGAMFGVLNIITKHAKELDGLSGDAVMGSNERQQAALQFGKTFLTGVAVSASVNWSETNGADLYYPEFDSPETNGGVAAGRDFENFRTAMATVTYGPFKAWARLTTRAKGIPTGSYDTNFNELERNTHGSQILGVDYVKAIGSDKQLDVRTFWLRHTSRGIYPYPGNETGIETASALRYGTEARLRWDMRANQRLVIGSELTSAPRASYTYKVGAYEIAFNRPLSLGSIYVQHEYQPLKNVSIVTGIRHDKFSHMKGSTNPRLAVIFTPTQKTSFKLLYGSAFRVANIYEMEYEDTVWGAKKNTALLPERVRSVEAVVEHRLTSDTFVVLSAYKLDVARLIEPVIDPADGLYQFQNVGTANARGVEAEINTRRKNGLWVYGSYAFQRTTEDGRMMSNSPQHLMKAGVSTNPWARFHGGLEVAYDSGRHTLQDTMTDAAMLVHGTISARVAHRTRLSLSVRNIFDVAYANAVGPEFRQASILQDGRTVALSLSFHP